MISRTRRRRTRNTRSRGVVPLLRLTFSVSLGSTCEHSTSQCIFTVSNIPPPSPPLTASLLSQSVTNPLMISIHENALSICKMLSQNFVGTAGPRSEKFYHSKVAVEGIRGGSGERGTLLPPIFKNTMVTWTKLKSAVCDFA